MYISLNGIIVPEDEAKVSVYDHGFLYGDGIYETMRVYGGVVLMLDRHLERLGRSASLIRLDLPDAAAIRKTVYETIEANGLSEAYVRVTVSRGQGPIGLDPALCSKPTIVIIAEQFRGYPQSYYDEGVRLIMARTMRNDARALDPRIKSLNFLNNILAKIEAKEQSAHEAIMLNTDGHIAEGTVSNIFFVRGGALCTPSVGAGILDGITREVVISLARRSGIDVREGLYLPDDLYMAEEVFFTNTTSEVMPVSAVDDRRFKIGPMSARLRVMFREEVDRALKADGRNQ